MTEPTPNSNSNNPYSNPYADPKQTAPVAPAGRYNDGMVKQIPILATLQIVMGCLELLIGGLFLFYSVFIPYAIRQAPNRQQQEMPDFMLNFMMAYFLIVGCICLLSSVLRIVSGIRMFSFKGRQFTLISLIVGLGSIGTFYCSLFAIAVAVYGFVLIFHPSIKLAFQLALSGWTSQQIYHYFASGLASEQAIAPESNPTGRS